jgi:hypothetical protein
MKSSKTKHNYFFAVCILVVIAFSTVLIFLFVKNESMNQNNFQETDLSKLKSSGTVDALKRAAIEKEYSEFADFENQKSFAGKEVKYEIINNDYYFAYMVLGSGLPIAQATCFRVDRLGRVYLIGEFPDPLDSYAGYPKINATNCKGIMKSQE